MLEQGIYHFLLQYLLLSGEVKGKTVIKHTCYSRLSRVRSRHV